MRKEGGNLHYFIYWKTEFDQNLKSYLLNSKYQYLSPKIQNEFIREAKNVSDVKGVSD